LGIPQVETVLVECKDNKEDCKTRIDSFKKKHRNVVSVRETIPFKDPEAIQSKIAKPKMVTLGNADFMVEILLDDKI